MMTYKVHASLLVKLVGAPVSKYEQIFKRLEEGKRFSLTSYYPFRIAIQKFIKYGKEEAKRYLNEDAYYIQHNHIDWKAKNIEAYEKFLELIENKRKLHNIQECSGKPLKKRFVFKKDVDGYEGVLIVTITPHFKVVNRGREIYAYIVPSEWEKEWIKVLCVLGKSSVSDNKGFMVIDLNKSNIIDKCGIKKRQEELRRTALALLTYVLDRLPKEKVEEFVAVVEEYEEVEM